MEDQEGVMRVSFKRFIVSDNQPVRAAKVVKVANLREATPKTFAGFATLAGGNRQEAAVISWMNAYQPDTDTNLCAQCKKPLGRIGEDAIAVLSGGGHVWLHHGCHPGWRRDLRARAEQALGMTNIDNQSTAFVERREQDQ
jgi:hypothetical protein